MTRPKGEIICLFFMTNQVNRTWIITPLPTPISLKSMRLWICGWGIFLLSCQSSKLSSNIGLNTFQSPRQNFDEGNFERFAKTIRLPKLQYSELVLEGGNIVNNGFDAAIIQPNDLSKTIQTCLKTSSSKNLKLLLNEKLQSCQIPTTQQGTPMVLCHLWKNMFCWFHCLMTQTAWVLQLHGNRSSSGLSSLKVVPLPCYAEKGKSRGFVLAEGSYANSLVSNNALICHSLPIRPATKMPLQSLKIVPTRKWSLFTTQVKFPCLEEAFAEWPGRWIKNTV